MLSPKRGIIVGLAGIALTSKASAMLSSSGTCDPTSDLPSVIQGWSNANLSNVDTDIITTLMAEAVADSWGLPTKIMNQGNGTFRSQLSFPNGSIYSQTVMDPLFTGNIWQISLSAAVGLMTGFKQELPDQEGATKETYLLPAFWRAAPLHTSWCDLKSYQVANITSNPYARPSGHSPVIAILDTGLVALNSSTLGGVNISQIIPDDLSGYNVSYWEISSTGCPHLRSLNTVDWYSKCASLVFVT